MTHQLTYARILTLYLDVSVEGIFRKAGNMRRLENLQDAIDRDPSSVDLTTDNAVQLAALLKRYLRELPDPLLTHKLHKLLAASQSMCLSNSLFPYANSLFSTPERGRSKAITAHDHIAFA
jgi:hypothetical protein